MKSLTWVGLTLLILMFGLTLSACSAAQASDPQTLPAATAAPADQEDVASTTSGSSQNTSNATSSQSNAEWPDGQAQQDAQGAVEVAITPLNLNNPGDTLDFEVCLNTHSVDLSMDLSTLATLTTGTGLSVQASLWEAPRGGHHVEGKLSFPVTSNGASILDGANQVTLTLVNLDAPERVFTWER